MLQIEHELFDESPEQAEGAAASPASLSIASEIMRLLVAKGTSDMADDEDDDYQDVQLNPSQCGFSAPVEIPEEDPTDDVPRNISGWAPNTANALRRQVIHHLAPLLYCGTAMVSLCICIASHERSKRVVLVTSLLSLGAGSVSSHQNILCATRFAGACRTQKGIRFVRTRWSCDQIAVPHENRV